jgi:hypothetical protein
MSRHPRPDEEYDEWNEIGDEDPHDGSESDVQEGPGDRIDVFGDKDAAEVLTDDFESSEEEVISERNRKGEILDKVQLELERMYQEDGHFIAYGILDGEIFPAFVNTSDDETYAHKQWLSEAEDMVSINYFLGKSEVAEPDILEEAEQGVPKGLDTYIQRPLEEVSNFEEYEWTETNKTYLMPK